MMIFIENNVTRMNVHRNIISDVIISSDKHENNAKNMELF